uniref:Uncharacterized protein n=1 Tax=Chelonoidis abingdonii TaxID=106734 RepID=A0A8C0IP07_CHEAB
MNINCASGTDQSRNQETVGFFIVLNVSAPSGLHYECINIYLYMCFYLSECLAQVENIISLGQMKRENMKLQKELVPLYFTQCWIITKLESLTAPMEFLSLISEIRAITSVSTLISTQSNVKT